MNTRMVVAGEIGYPTKMSSPAVMAPRERASLPLMTTRGCVSSGGSSRSATLKPAFVTSSKPSPSAWILAAMICSSLGRPRVKRTVMKSSK